MTGRATSPGVTFTLVPRVAEASPLRTDIACFLGPAARGPLGRLTRVEGWKSYLALYGGLGADFDTPYSVRSYFTNGGEIAWMLRLNGTADPALPAATASALLIMREFDGVNWTGDSLFVTPGSAYQVEASSPGEWGNGLEVEVRFIRDGLRGEPELEVIVTHPEEEAEFLTGLNPRKLDDADPADEGEFTRQVAERSRLIRFRAVSIDGEPENLSAGPRFRTWGAMKLQGGSNPVTGAADYLSAVEASMQEPEIALLAMPDLYAQVPVKEEYVEILERTVVEADLLHDRQVLVDVPWCASTGKAKDAKGAVDWSRNLRDRVPDAARTFAVYHPGVTVEDPEGGAMTPLRKIPASGPVAGLISRLDRERTPYYTPANASLYEIVDVARGFSEEEQGALHASGVNPLRCFPGKGIMVWGGRTLAGRGENPFLAHRRLIHRLVRAIRRVAEPLVFDVNGPALWQTFQRTVTGVLLRAYRAGALKGDRPEQAFRVKCDAETNPPESIDAGRVVCEIEVAPAAPMEFIHLRVALSAEGALEVFED